MDAYFPLSESRTPEAMELEKGWQKWKAAMARLSEEKDRPVLFTEFGYRSMDYAARKPWESARNGQNVNLKAQENAIGALFEAFWGEEWFAGGFLWKWFIRHDRSGGSQDNRFTPQNKPAQAVIARYYAQN